MKTWSSVAHEASFLSLWDSLVSRGLGKMEQLSHYTQRSSKSQTIRRNPHPGDKRESHLHPNICYDKTFDLSAVGSHCIYYPVCYWRLKTSHQTFSHGHVGLNQPGPASDETLTETQTISDWVQNSAVTQVTCHLLLQKVLISKITSTSFETAGPVLGMCVHVWVRKVNLWVKVS